MKIAITGGLCSGKSTVSRILAEILGFEYFSCDAYVSQLYRNKNILKKIVDTFPDSVYNNGKFHKKKLAEIVFESEKKLKKLESILHPFVINEILKYSKDTVFEIPLLYETKLHKKMDYCVLVSCRQNIARNRALKKGLTKKEFNQRIRFQMPEKEKKKFNPIIITNHQPINQLKLQIKKIASGIIHKRKELVQCRKISVRKNSPP